MVYDGEFMCAVTAVGSERENGSGGRRKLFGAYGAYVRCLSDASAVEMIKIGRTHTHTHDTYKRKIGTYAPCPHRPR